MNVWKLIAANSLIKEETALPEREEGKIKVRVTKVFLNGTDASLFNGTGKVKYPVIPGRFALGIVSEDCEAAGLNKGARVLLHTFLPVADGGTAKKDFSEEEYVVCGRTGNGFLRDFLYADANALTAIPDSVSDEKALLAEHVALAKATVEALDVQKGQHIAVIGADMLGLFLCQLLIYQQACPILIDSLAVRLDFARSCGVYYTVFADDSLLDNVAEITGGRMTDGAIYVTSVTNDKSIPFKVCSREKSAVFCGFRGHDLSINLDLVMKKHLTVYGVADGAGHVPTAINLLANKAIDTSQFRFHAYPAAKTEEIIAMESNPERDIRDVDIIELI